MGYTFTIGNAVPKHHKSDFPHLSATWDVDAMTHLHAPTFPNDEMTANSNSRSPSYSTWADFCNETGLRDVFFIPHKVACTAVTLAVSA